MNKTHVIKNYLENNPEATYAEFKESGPKTAVSRQYFYAVQKNLRGGIGRRTKNPVYVAVFFQGVFKYISRRQSSSARILVGSEYPKEIEIRTRGVYTNYTAYS